MSEEPQAESQSETAKSETAKSETAKSETAKSETAKSEPRSAKLPEPELPAAGTPEGDALRRARALFEIGDNAGMRAILTPLTTSKDPAVADAAATLLRRIAVDPIQIGFLVGCLVAIVAVAVHYLGH